MDYRRATFQDIMNDAEAKGDEAIDFLDELVNSIIVDDAGNPVLDEDGNTSYYSFVMVKKQYFAKYYPELLPKPRGSMRDQMKKLKKSRG